MNEVKTFNDTQTQVISGPWRDLPPGTYQRTFDAVFMPEGSGWWVYVPSLPGVASEGETLEEAKRNIVEAVIGAIEAYRQYGEKVPWQNDREALAAVPQVRTLVATWKEPVEPQ